MILNIAISTCFYALLLWMGRMLMFVDPIIYYSIPVYLLLLILVMRLYDENCKAMEGKDFVITALFVGGISIAYGFNLGDISFDFICYLYLACFIPYIAYASSIRYKSLV